MPAIAPPEIAEEKKKVEIKKSGKKDMEGWVQIKKKSSRRMIVREKVEEK